MKDTINAQLQFSPLYLLTFLSSYYHKKNPFTPIFNKSNITYSLKMEVMLELFFSILFPYFFKDLLPPFQIKYFLNTISFFPILLPTHPASRFNFNVLQSEDRREPLLDSEIFTLSLEWKLIFLPILNFLPQLLLWGIRSEYVWCHLESTLTKVWQIFSQSPSSQHILKMLTQEN